MPGTAELPPIPSRNKGGRYPHALREHSSPRGIHIVKQPLSSEHFDPIFGEEEPEAKPSASDEASDIDVSELLETPKRKETVAERVIPVKRETIDVPPPGHASPILPEIIKRGESGRAQRDIILHCPKETDEMTESQRQEVDHQQREYIVDVAKAFGFPVDMAERMRDLPTKYLPLRRLSKQGAMGQVFEVLDLNVAGRHLIMKTIKQQGKSAAIERAFDRFKREAQLAASIRNEHVASVKSADFMPDGSGAWYVMEKAEGEDAEALLDREGPLPIPEALNFMEQVADGVAAAHAKKIVHRDLKPANIIVHRDRDREGNETRVLYKVTDFGLSKGVEAEQDKLEWVKQQFINLAENKETVDRLRKLGIPEDSIANMETLLTRLQEGNALASLGEINWREELRNLPGGKELLLALEMIAVDLPGGNAEYTYDVVLHRLEEQKRHFLHDELIRLSRTDDPLHENLRVPDGLSISLADQKRLKELAVGYQSNKETFDPSFLDRLADRVQIRANLTMAEATVGTPGYMSPEQVRGVVLDTKSDVFGLGNVFYEALTGRQAFKADSLQTLFHEIVDTDPPSIEELRPEVPQRISDLIAWMMEKDPEHRPTMEEVKAELRKAAVEWQKVSSASIPAQQERKVSSVRLLLQKLFGSSEKK